VRLSEVHEGDKMSNRTVYFLILLFLFPLAPAVESAEDIRLTWRLKDKNSGKPLENAHVICEIERPRQLIRKGRVRTNPDGQFTIEFDREHENREINLIVIKPGYKETTFVDYVKRGRSLPRYLHLSAWEEEDSVSEKRSLVVLGTVKDSKNEKTLQGVVLDYDLRVHGREIKSKKDTTDSSGDFTWQFDGKLSEGVLNFKAYKPNYARFRQAQTLGEGGKLDIYLVPEKREGEGWSVWKGSLLVGAAFGSLFTAYNEEIHPGWSKTHYWIPIGTALAWVGFLVSH